MTERTGKVSFVGAGPGRPDLITERGRRLLQSADAVLYDYLADDRLLELVPPEAQVICLGKHGTGRLWDQQAIHAKLVELAREGQHVVRLKGGDPALFARLGEELEAIRSHDIPYEIVPGVTAALGAAAFDSLSLTHRDWASAVTLVTGHEAPHKKSEPPIDFAQLARLPGTLVVYMGVTTVERWCAELLAGGKPPQTPVRVIRRATWPDQRTEHCRLHELPRLVQERRLRPPVVFVIGEAALGEQPGWYERLPLFGQTIVVTRPRHQASRLQQLFEEQGAATLRQPAIEIGPPDSYAPLDEAIAGLGDFEWIVFSSVNGVDHFFRRLWDTGRDTRALGHVRLAAIGPATAQALEARHVRPELVPARFRAEALAEGLVARGGRSFLLVRASRGRDALERSLKASGGAVTSVVAYRHSDVTTADPQLTDRLEAGEISWVTVTSSAIARSIVRLWGDRLHRTQLASISPVTSATLRELGFPPAAEATVYTMEGLVQAVVDASSRTPGQGQR